MKEDQQKGGADKEAWARFERAVDAAVKSGPKHKVSTPVSKKERPASKGPVHKGKTRN
jgi:hypothetical protein